MICQNDKLPKLKKLVSNRKLLASYWEALSRIILNLYLSSAHVTPDFVINSNT